MHNLHKCSNKQTASYVMATAQQVQAGNSVGKTKPQLAQAYQ